MLGSIAQLCDVSILSYIYMLYSHCFTIHNINYRHKNHTICCGVFCDMIPGFQEVFGPYEGGTDNPSSGLTK